MAGVKHEHLLCWQGNNGPASLCRQSGPAQSYKDKIRTFLADTVPGGLRWRMVAVGALARRPDITSLVTHRGKLLGRV